MGFSNVLSLILVLVPTTCMLLLAAASDSATANQTAYSRRIIVGGSRGWTYGFNYSQWASQNGPFYINDVLVFKSDLPNPFKHNVYVMPNLKSYSTCDFKGAKKIADLSKGAGNGFEYKIMTLKPHYFASSLDKGVHCRIGTMKFYVTPMIRS